MVLRTGGLGIGSLGIYRVSLSLQGKQLAAFVTNDRIPAFEQELEFWETGLHHHELDSFPVLGGFSDEAGGDINECNFWGCVDIRKTCRTQ